MQGQTCYAIMKKSLTLGKRMLAPGVEGPFFALFPNGSNVAAGGPSVSVRKDIDEDVHAAQVRGWFRP